MHISEQKCSGKAGMTLIELIIALALLSIILVAGSSLFVFSAKTQSKAWTRTDANYSAYGEIEEVKTDETKVVDPDNAVARTAKTIQLNFAESGIVYDVEGYVLAIPVEGGRAFQAFTTQ